MTMHQPISRSPLIEINDLRFTYIGQTQPTLSVAHWEIQPGELVMLTGATGSGKSTFINCLTGIAPEYTGGQLHGTITYQGQDITDWSIRQRSQFMSIMRQNVESQLFTDRVQTELEFGLENWNIPPHDIATLTELALIDFGLQPQRAWPIKQLSAGQKQRLLVASLHTQQPKLLVLDEPFAFLDRGGVNQLLLLLRDRLAQGETVLLVEHRLELLRQLQIQVEQEQRAVTVYNLDAGQLSPSQLSTLDNRWATLPAVTAAAPDRSAPPILRTENLSWGGFPRFPDLTVSAGDVLLIQGENGCGKTTLLKLLSGLLKATTGQIYTANQNITHQNAVQRSRFLGFVLQNPNHQLFAASVLAEIHQTGVTKAQAQTWLERLNLMHCAHQHPQALSQGQKRRLTLGAVLARQPEICLLDEIMVGQDPQSLEVMLNALQVFTQWGGTLLFTSHDPGVAKMLQPRVMTLDASASG